MKSSSLRDLNVSLEELKDIARLLARKRGIKGYKSIPKDKILTVNEYLHMVRPYLVDMINDHKNKSEWKIQLTAVINLFLLNQILMTLLLWIQKVIT